MTEEFNLSEKIHKENTEVFNIPKEIKNLQRIEIKEEEHIPVLDVKEFIKRLKEDTKEKNTDKQFYTDKERRMRRDFYKELIMKIDKLAGEKLK